MKLFIVFVLCATVLPGAVVAAYGDTQPVDDADIKLAPRTAFKLQLAKINIAYDKERKKYNQVKIYFDESGAHSIIAPGDDMQIGKNGESTVYRELPQKTYMLSDFEARTISQVCRTLISTLEEYDKILKNKEWGRALYLDSFFPRFMQGFHTMVCAAKDSPDALPRDALVFDEDYDVSLNSPKSDVRINMWQTDKDRIIKLRIATQELILQTKKWQKNELDNPKRNPELAYSSDFDRALTSFVRNYFGRIP